MYARILMTSVLKRKNGMQRDKKKKTKSVTKASFEPKQK